MVPRLIAGRRIGGPAWTAVFLTAAGRDSKEIRFLSAVRKREMPGKPREMAAAAKNIDYHSFQNIIHFKIATTPGGTQ
jgi:hypothetical protein